MKVGHKLKQLKEQKKLKLKDISMDTGLSVSYISDILNERSSPSLDSLKKLSDSLGVALSFVMEPDGAGYRTASEADLYDLLKDFSSWPLKDQQDLLDYIRAKRDIIRLETKKDRPD